MQVRDRDMFDGGEPDARRKDLGDDAVARVDEPRRTRTPLHERGRVVAGEARRRRSRAQQRDSEFARRMAHRVG